MADKKSVTAPALTPAEELNALRERRQALERIVRVTQVVERLHRGLEAALLMGQTPRELARKAQGYLRHLDQATLIQPSKDLQIVLANLDREVQGSLARVMAFAKQEQEQELSEQIATAPQPPGDLSSIFALLGKFRRGAQTAVALRLLLRERGVAIAPVQLQVSRAEIETQIQVLKARENVCRALVKDEIAQIQASLERLLEDERFTESVRLVMRNVQADLRRNLAHLEAGGSLDELPVLVEAIELAEEPLPAMAPSPAPSVPPAPLPAERRRRLGLLRHLWLWLTGPWGQGWNEIEDSPKPWRKRK